MSEQSLTIILLQLNNLLDCGKWWLLLLTRRAELFQFRSDERNIRYFDTVRVRVRTFLRMNTANIFKIKSSCDVNYRGICEMKWMPEHFSSIRTSWHFVGRTTQLRREKRERYVKLLGIQEEYLYKICLFLTSLTRDISYGDYLEYLTT